LSGLSFVPFPPSCSSLFVPTESIPGVVRCSPGIAFVSWIGLDEMRCNIQRCYCNCSYNCNRNYCASISGSSSRFFPVLFVREQSWNQEGIHWILQTRNKQTYLPIFTSPFTSNPSNFFSTKFKVLRRSTNYFGKYESDPVPGF
jgi:hypothetical protein